MSFPEEVRQSDWQRKKVRTLIVNCRAKIPAHRSINSAIAAAKPYDRIELAGGEYTESISISKPIEIVSAEGEDAVVTSAEASLQCTAVGLEAYFQGLHFTGISKDPSVVVCGSTLHFDRCAVQTMSVVSFGKVVCEHCEINEGFVLRGFGSGSATRSSFRSRSGVTCIDADTMGDFTFEDNVIEQEARGVAVRCGGIRSRAEAQASATNPLSPESRHRIATDPCANIAFRRNMISYRPQARDLNKRGSIDVLERKGSLKAVTAGGATATASLAGDVACVYVCEEAKPTFVENEVCFGEIGCVMDSGGKPILQRNAIRRQSRCGIRVYIDTNVNRSQQNGVVIDEGNMFDECAIGVDVKVQMILQPELASGSRSSLGVSQDLSRSSFDPVDRHEGNNNPPWTVLRANELSKLRRFAESAGKWPLPEKERSKAGADELLRFLDCGFPPLGSGVQVCGTAFQRCTDCGVRFTGGSYGCVRHCQFICCNTGIRVEEGATPVVEESLFDKCTRSGLHASRLSCPVLVHCEFSNHPNDSAVIDFHSRGVIFQNTFLGSEHFGVSIMDASTPLLFGNFFKNNSRGGIGLSRGAKGNIVQNTFHANRKSQIFVTDYSNPFIAQNDIQFSMGGGIHFTDCSLGTVSENTIAGNAEEGIVVELGADPVIVQNIIERNRRAGVLCRANSLGTFSSNTLSANGRCNFECTTGADPVVRANTMTDAAGGGILVADEGIGLFEKNELRTNRTANVVIEDKHSDPVFVANDIHHSSDFGIIAQLNCSGTFRRNHVHNNGRCGMQILAAASPKVISNLFTCEAVGIVISDEGHGTIVSNKIMNCYRSGMLVERGGGPQLVSKNLVASNGVSGIVVGTTAGQGLIEDNDFKENTFCGVRCCSESGQSLAVALCGVQQLSAADDIVQENKSRSHSKNVTQLQLCKNRITENGCCGVLLESNAAGKFVENEISKNAEYGILADFNVQQEIAARQRSSGAVAVQGTAGLMIAGGGTATFILNTISENGYINVYFRDFSGDNNICFERNIVSLAPLFGVYMEHASFLHKFSKNSVVHSCEGIFCDDSAHGNFEENTVEECSRIGFHIARKAHPSVREKNCFRSCGFFGLVIDFGGSGEICDCTMEKNGFAGIALFAEPGCTPLLERNSCVQNEYVGLYVACSTSDARRDAGMVYFPLLDSNIFQGNRCCGVYLEQEQKLPLLVAPPRSTNGVLPDVPDREKVFAPHGRAVQSSTTSSKRKSLFDASPLGTVEGFESTDKVVATKLLQTIVLRQNVIDANRFGIIVGTKCDAAFVGNKISGNEFCGVVLKQQADPVFFQNLVTENGCVGVFCSQTCRGSFIANKVCSNENSDAFKHIATELPKREDDDGSIRWRNGACEALVDAADEAMNDTKFALSQKVRSMDSVLSTLVVSAKGPKEANEGIGIWIEQSATTEFTRNNICDNSMCGVRFVSDTVDRTGSSAKLSATRALRFSLSFHHTLPDSSRAKTAMIGGTCILRENDIHNNSDGIVVHFVFPEDEQIDGSPHKPSMQKMSAKDSCGSAIGASIVSEAIVKRMELFDVESGAKLVALRAESNNIHHNTRRGVMVESGTESHTDERACLAVAFTSNQFSYNEECSFEVEGAHPLDGATSQSQGKVIVLLDENDFADSRRGVLLHSGTPTAIRANTFVRTDCAIVVEGYGTCGVIGPANKFTGTGTGIRLQDNYVPFGASPTERTIIFDNSFESNKKCGIHVLRESSPIVYRNKLRKHGQGSTGVLLEGLSAVGRFLGNAFEENDCGFVVCWYSQVARIESNLFKKNVVGALIATSGGGCFTRNVFQENRVAGARICGSGTTSPVFFHNIFAANQTGGIVAEAPAGGCVNANLFTENNNSILCVCPEGKHSLRPLLVKENYIRGSSSFGVLATGNFALPQTAILSNVAEPDSIELATSVFSAECSSDKTSVECAGGATMPQESVHKKSVIFVSNFFDNNASADFCIREGAVPWFAANVVLGKVASSFRGKGAVFANYFLGKSVDPAISIEAESRTWFAENSIRSCHVGIHSSTSAEGHVEKNILRDCAVALEADTDSATRFTGNIVYGTTDCGVRAAGAIFMQNDVMRCPVGFVAHSDKSRTKSPRLLALQIAATESQEEVRPIAAGPQIVQNNIHHCGGDGIVVAGDALVSENTVYWCKNNVRVVSTSAMPTIEKNTILDATVAGLLLCTNSKAFVRENHVFDCSTGGIAEVDSRCVVENNNFSTPDKDGAFEASPQSCCTMLNNTIKNRFSPGYKRGMRSHREVDYAKEMQSWSQRVEQLDAQSVDVLTRMRNVAAAMDALKASVEPEAQGELKIDYHFESAKKAAKHSALDESAAAAKSAIAMAPMRRRGTGVASTSQSATAVQRSVAVAASVCVLLHTPFSDVPLGITSAIKQAAPQSVLVLCTSTSDPIPSLIKNNSPHILMAIFSSSAIGRDVVPPADSSHLSSLSRHAAAARAACCAVVHTNDVDKLRSSKCPLPISSFVHAHGYVAVNLQNEIEVAKLLAENFSNPSEFRQKIGVVVQQATASSKPAPAPVPKLTPRRQTLPTPPAPLSKPSQGLKGTSNLAVSQTAVFAPLDSPSSGSLQRKELPQKSHTPIPLSSRKNDASPKPMLEPVPFTLQMHAVTSVVASPIAVAVKMKKPPHVTLATTCSTDPSSSVHDVAPQVIIVIIPAVAIASFEGLPSEDIAHLNEIVAFLKAVKSCSCVVLVPNDKMSLDTARAAASKKPKKGEGVALQRLLHSQGFAPLDFSDPLGLGGWLAEHLTNPSTVKEQIYQASRDKPAKK